MAALPDYGGHHQDHQGGTRFLRKISVSAKGAVVQSIAPFLFALAHHDYEFIPVFTKETEAA